MLKGTGIKKTKGRVMVNDRPLVNARQVYEQALIDWPKLELKTGIENYPKKQSDLLINLFINELKGRLKKD